MFKRMPLERPMDMLREMRVALADVVASLSEIPGHEKDLVSLRALLNSMKSITAHESEQIGLFHHLENSRLFCKTIAEYIYNQSADYCLGCVDHPNAAKRQLFSDQKKALFGAAENALKVNASDVYDLARSCDDLITVDELTFYYGGAGRPCSDSHMTKIFTRMEDAERFAVDYLLAHTPKINYIEIFEALRKGRHAERLFPDGLDVLMKYLDKPESWMGSRMFFDWLKKTGVSFDEFWSDFNDIFSESDWLRPYLSIKSHGEEWAVCHNMLHFDPGYGCRWDIQPYSYFESMRSPQKKG